MKRLMGATLSLSLLLVASVYANESTHPMGDPEAGKVKSVTCQACHGADGTSIAPTFPNLAGQVPGYISKQVKAFQAGDRVDQTMAPMVAALTETDMIDLDAFYASLPAKVGTIMADQEEQALKGKAIYRGGVAEFSVAACMACHGPDGAGIQPNFPKLSGQRPAYIEKQLQEFKSGVRKDPMMNPIAFPLSDAQIKQLATYLSGLY